MTVDEAGNSSLWSREQVKAFENALATHSDDDSLDLWDKIAADVPGKTLQEIKHHYELLVDDVNSIESGLVPLPPYTFPNSDGSKNRDGDIGPGKKSGSSAPGNFNADSGPGSGGKPSRPEQERRKGIAWTEEEHRLFLLGLDKYGKGDWRSISRNFVATRTPTQVASHAQKYFIRLNSVNKDRRRSSIHDITSVETGELSMSQGPITGQGNGSAAVIASSGKFSKQPPQPQATAPGLGTYGGSAIAQSMAIGTPVNHPAPMGYGTPMSIGSMGFPMPPTSVNR